MGSDTDLLGRYCQEESVGFNPSVGILWVQTRYSKLHFDRLWSVSIPQSGFYGFRLFRREEKTIRRGSFNPSVGILWVQTCSDHLCRCHALERVSIPQSGFYGFRPSLHASSRIKAHSFQSLSRDSMGSDLIFIKLSASGLIVSIPQSGFYGFRLRRRLLMKLLTNVSIPQSGFYGFRPCFLQRHLGGH